MVLGAYYYRIDGVISVRLATGLFMSFCSMMALQELIGTPVSKQLLAPWRPVACASIMALVIRSSDKWLMNLSIEGWAIDEAAEVVAVGQDGFGRIATALKIIAMDPALEFRDGR